MGAKPATRSIGIQGESVCAKYLSTLDYKILTRNWYCRWGEIDIVAKDKQELVFVEVKTVNAHKYCTAKELFNPTKRLKLLRTINCFIYRYNAQKVRWRLDLVCITRDGLKLWIDHYKNVLAL